LPNGLINLRYSGKSFLENEGKYKRELIAWTKFGAGAGWQGKFRAEHGILDRSEFNMTPFVKNLQDKAVNQLGSSGGGNHFVEFGIIEFEKDDEKLNIKREILSVVDSLRIKRIWCNHCRTLY